jgi:hypothetical protein
MPDFEVKISRPVQLQGAQQLAGQPGKDIGKTNALGEAAGPLEDKPDRFNATIASAREEAKKGGDGPHEAYAAVQARGEASPGVGQMARFLANGVTATIGGALLMLSKFQDAMRETMESLKAAHAPDARGEWLDKEREAARKEWKDAAKPAREPEAELKKLLGNINVEREKSAALENVQRQTAESRADASVFEERQNLRRAIESGIDIDSARAALDGARRDFQAGQGNAQELRDLMNEFIGLAADIHAAAAQKRDVSELERQVEELRQQVANNRGGR